MLIQNAVVLTVGKFNGRRFTVDDLDGIAKSFDFFGLSGRVPLKLGHARDDPSTQFALGWVVAVRRDGMRLAVDLDVPDETAALIRAGKLRFMSIELLRDVEAEDGSVHALVLDAIALLGTDRPAIPAVSDLRALTAARQCPAVRFAERLSVTGEDDDDEIATALREVRELKRELDARAGRVQAAEVLAVQLKDANTKLIAQTFAAAIRDGKCLPAAREQFARRHGTTGTVADAIEFIASCPRPPARGPASRAQVPDDDADAPADFRLTVKARRLIREHRRETGETLSFSAAAATVVKLPENSALVAEWRTMMGET